MEPDEAQLSLLSASRLDTYFHQASSLPATPSVIEAPYEIAPTVPDQPLRSHQQAGPTYTSPTCASFEYPVPSAIRNSVQQKYIGVDANGLEFSHLRYTPITVDPDDFTLKNGYDLRPRYFRRHTEVMVAITCYNEDKESLCRTLHSVVQECRLLCRLKKSTFWQKGGPSWQKIVICLLVDGIDSCDSGFLDILATIGLFQRQVTRTETLDGNDVTGHLFEYTTQLSVTPSLWLDRPQEMDVPPLQMMLLIKAKNLGKINSYRWMYNAFARMLAPEIVVNVDVGTRLENRSLLYFWEAFYHNADLGAACGEIVCPGGWRSYLNPLVAAQNFEYKVGFQLERTLESSTGYISVLPGAFSAYRFRSNMGAPLVDSFLGDPSSKDHTNISLKPFQLNRYLADDRIICFGVISKAGQKWHLEYISGARAETDVPKGTADFINQRRRWLNGALFSTLHTARSWGQLYKSAHNLIRLSVLHVQLVYNVLNLVLAWFSLAAFLLTTFTINSIAGDPPSDAPVDGFPFGRATPAVNSVIQILYMAMILIQFILAVGSRPKNHSILYFVSFVFFAFVQFYMLINIIYLVKRLADFHADTNGASNYGYINQYYADLGPSTVIVTAFCMFGVYIIGGLLALDPWHLLTCYAQFLFISSSYVNILQIFAFSNLQDVSWGQKSGKKSDTGGSHRPHEPAATTHSGKLHSNMPANGNTTQKQMEAIDAEFEQTVKRALEPDKWNPTKQPPTPEDSLLEFRTFILAVYVFSNFFLCMVIMDTSLKPLWFLGDDYWHKIWFFRVWMWLNNISYLFRLVGCIYYQIRRISRHIVR